MNFDVQLLTNGVLLKDNIDIINYADSIIISIDTFDEFHNVRRGLNIFKLKNTLENIDLISRNKISLRSVISKYNRDSWKSIELFAVSHKYKFIPALYIPDKLEDTVNMIDISEMRMECGEVTFGGSLCGACYRIIAIDSNGDVFPCQCLIREEYKITNLLLDDCFAQLSNSNITKHFMSLDVTNYEKCKECDIKYICGGGCRAIAKKVYGSTNSHIAFLCPFQRKLSENKISPIQPRITCSINKACVIL